MVEVQNVHRNVILVDSGIFLGKKSIKDNKKVVFIVDIEVINNFQHVEENIVEGLTFEKHMWIVKKVICIIELRKEFIR